MMALEESFKVAKRLHKAKAKLRNVMEIMGIIWRSLPTRKF